MMLRVSDEKKRTQYKFKENEGLQFAFDVEQDKAEEVVQQMIEQGHIPDCDVNVITKLIRDKIDAFKRDREYRHTEMKRAQEEEERKAEEAAVKEEIKLRREREKEAAAQKAQYEAAAAAVAPPVNPSQQVGTEPHAQSVPPAVVNAAKRSKKKIVLEVLQVVQSDENKQPVNKFYI